jgi:hypothetical protein
MVAWMSDAFSGSWVLFAAGGKGEVMGKTFENHKRQQIFTAFYNGC